MRRSLTLMVIVLAVVALTAGCKNKPPSIPARPAGPDSIPPDDQGSYATFSTDPNQDQIKYIFDWGDGSADTTGFLDSGDTASVYHAWSDTGFYAVKALAEDDKGNQSAEWSDSLLVTVSEGAPSQNDPPDAPDAPVGPDSGALGSYYVFTTQATDPDGDSVRIRFIWAEGNVSTWSPLVANGTAVSDSVRYIDGGTKYIRAVAMDVDSAISDTSDAKEFGIINTAPGKPVVEGPARGIKDGPWYRFGARAVDPEGDSVQYKFFWGDGNASGWTPLGLSGLAAMDSWRYSSETGYEIKAIARDPDGAESDTSDPFDFLVVGEGEIIWWLLYGDGFTSSPALGMLQNNVGENRYGVAIGYIEGFMYGIDAYQGEQLFAVNELGMENFNSSPAFGDDGTIYIGNENGGLYAVTGEGDVKWDFPDSLSDNDMGTTPALDGNIIYVGGENRMLHKVQDAGGSGTQQWAVSVQDEMISSPAIDPSGNIIFTDDSGFVYSLTAAGDTNWTYFAESTSFTSSPAVGSDGTVYIGTEQGKLLAITSAGAPAWEYLLPLVSISSSPVIGSDGSIFFGGEDGGLYRLDSDGTPVADWPVLLGGQISATPAIASGDMIYVVAEDNKLYAVDIATHTIAWSVILAPPVGAYGGRGARTMGVDDLWSSPVIDQYGIVYVGSGEDGVFAVAGLNGDLANTPWPMFHHDKRHTGKSGDW